jgi:hypothetical protein
MRNAIASGAQTLGAQTPHPQDGAQAETSGGIDS